MARSRGLTNPRVPSRPSAAPRRVRPHEPTVTDTIHFRSESLLVSSCEWKALEFEVRGLTVTTVRKILTNHLPLVLSTLAATTVVAKMWTVAHGGLTGIAALVASGGLTSLLGALLAGLPAIGTACMLAAGVFLPEAIREGDDLRGPIVGTLAALSIGFVLAPVFWFLLGLGLFVVTTSGSFLIVGARRQWTRSSTRKLPFMLRESVHKQRVPTVATLALIAMLGWIAAATSDRPWLPPKM